MIVTIVMYTKIFKNIYITGKFLHIHTRCNRIVAVDRNREKSIN